MGKPIYQCTGCGAKFEEGEVKPVFQCSITHREPYRGSGHFIDCPRCGKFEGVKDLRMPPPVAVPDTDRPVMKQPTYDTETIATQGPGQRGMSAATATVLGMVAALAPEPPPRPSIGGQEQCTSCGQVERHSPTCAPPRGYRKV